MHEVLHRLDSSSQMWPCLCLSLRVSLRCTPSGAGKSLRQMRIVSHMPHMCVVLVHHVFPGGHPDAKCLSRWGHVCHKGEPSGQMNRLWQDAHVTLPQKRSAQKMPLHPSPRGNNQGPSKPLLLWLESLPLSQVGKVLSPVTIQQP